MSQYMTDYVENLEKLNEAKIQRISELERENAALREDKERLDWLETHIQHVSEVGNPQMDGTRFVGQHRDATGRQHCRMSGRSMRAAIDAARKEAQP